LLHAVVPGTKLTERPAALLAAYAISLGIVPLLHVAVPQLVAFRDKWNTTKKPETWSTGCLSLLLKADRFLEKRGLVSPGEESILRVEDRKLFQTLVDYKKLEKSLTATLNVKVGWHPSNIEAAVIHVETCHTCNRRRSVTVMTSDGICRYCSAGRNAIDAPEDHDESTLVLWTECGSCQAQYIVDDNKGKSPKCFYCRSGCTAQTVECSKCLSRIIWPEEIRPKGLDLSSFQCYACVSGVSTIESRKTTVRDLVEQNVSSFLRNDDDVITNPLKGMSLFDIASSCDLAHLSSKVQVLPENNSPLLLDGKLIHNQTDLKAKLRDMILPQETEECAFCLEEKPDLQSVCTDTRCSAVMCKECANEWYGESGRGNIRCTCCKRPVSKIRLPRN
jgi:hypothetical protein